MVFGLVPKTCCFSGKKSLKTGRSFFLEKSDVSPFGYPPRTAENITFKKYLVKESKRCNN